MQPDKERIAQKLLADAIISEKEVAAVKAYRSLGIFSLHNELLFLLYASVLLFTSGAGILIYKNIDTIGHTIILALLLLVCLGCYYFCYKKAKGFSKQETFFDHPLYDYLVLAATLLGCIFIGYLQFQYRPFGDQIAIPTLISALVALGSAYYFDNRSALSIGITGLAASIGITVTPKALLENDFFDNPSLFYYGIALGILLMVWSEFSEKNNLKKHFVLIFICFAQHLIGICTITGLFDDFWPLHASLLSGASFYLYRKSHVLQSTTVFVFVLVYAYIGANILIFKMINALELADIFGLLTVLSPVYMNYCKTLSFSKVRKA